ncbi:Putative major facilitator superfamily, MFS transporter superfamily [Colletotrichum destructivum]|uniref:Major facilitator superfamily, MFS transporter superfamily n=1 Tax=Colletotrichum destructivum TaxID=34406 RepID=A0AAX4J3M9_9PEZI|nr:Putative major facilitator superfamily, MFS transporter superfamily [Colletotrichum destructivum]
MSSKLELGHEKQSKTEGIYTAAFPSERAAALPSSEQPQQPPQAVEEDGASSFDRYSWNGSDDPENPYNWPSLRKISISVIVSFGQLVTLMSTSMMAAALGRISHDLGIDESTTQVTFSIFILGLAFAPFPIASFSEMYGRKPVWLFCNAFYVLWNALCPVGSLPALMIISRFLAGSGASLTGPIMADMYRKEERGKSLAIATFVPYLGPALGPIVGGIITQKLEWPWLFYLLSIFNAVIWVVGLVFVRESYGPVLISRKRKAEAASGASSTGPTSLKGASSKMVANLRRPLQLLWQRPIIQVIALVMALNFGVYCLLLSTFATLWINRYRQSEFISTLHYISVSVGTTIATQAGGHFMDWVFAKQKARSPDGSTSPEFRVPCLVPPVILIPVGLFWYGWAAEVGAHWAVVDVGVAVFVCGSFLLAQAMLAYLLDEFSHAASANAASRMLSNVIGFVFPIFAPQLFARLGYGWGNSMLAFLFIGLGWPVPLLLWVWGPRLRALGRIRH